MENINQIFLIGMMGSGKSSTGKALADSLNWTFYDIDNELEKDHNLSITLPNELYNQFFLNFLNLFW